MNYNQKLFRTSNHFCPVGPLSDQSVIQFICHLSGEQANQAAAGAVFLSIQVWLGPGSASMKGLVFDETTDCPVYLSSHKGYSAKYDFCLVV